MLALEAPLAKLTVAAGALAIVAAFAPHRHDHHHRWHHHHHEDGVHRLVLHANSSSSAIYVTAFDDDYRYMAIDPQHLQVMQFEITETVYGCLWQGTETLIPDGNHYDYTYEDHIIEYPAGCTPTNPTPRSGVVTIE